MIQVHTMSVAFYVTNHPAASHFEFKLLIIIASFYPLLSLFLPSLPPFLNPEEFIYPTLRFFRMFPMTLTYKRCGTIHWVRKLLYWRREIDVWIRMCQAINSGRNTERNGHFEENLLRGLSVVLKVIVTDTASAWFRLSGMVRNTTQGWLL